jgi:diadenosine tetraphosphate (Ap4A) HIT family hydrolase
LSRPSPHPRLLEDCHWLGRFGLSHVLLHRNASVPWFILVPQVGPEIVDLHELDASQRRLLDEEIDSVATFVKQEFGARKLNIAAIGNLVPQLHVHVVGRHEGDPCWPRVVWGNLPEGPAWPPERVPAIAHALAGVRALDRETAPA